MGRMKDTVTDNCVAFPEDRNDHEIDVPKITPVRGAKNATIDCKPDYSLIPESFMDQVAYALMAGQMKYLRDNYRKGHTSNQLTSAAGRHLKKIEKGEDIDADTTARLRDGCTDLEGKFNKGYGDKAKQVYHWACVAASALMALEQIELGTHIDDRFKGKKE